MYDGYCRLKLPANLAAFYHVSDVIKTSSQELTECNSDVIVNRDLRGRISTVDYYSPERELVKKVLYNGENVHKISHYRGGQVYCTEEYDKELIINKLYYNKKNSLVYSVDYEYNKKGFVTKISKNTPNYKIVAEFKYDELSRLIERTIFNNSEKVLKQRYRYDILDRIISYNDDNQSIVVNKISKQNELLSYTITDAMGNKIDVENHIDDKNGYEYTEVILNGHGANITDYNFVDNVMLKKPYTTEDDLDLIISNFFRKCDDVESVNRENSSEKISKELIDKSIELRVLPISMRKRMLLNC